MWLSRDNAENQGCAMKAEEVTGSCGLFALLLLGGIICVYMCAFCVHACVFMYVCMCVHMCR